MPISLFQIDISNQLQISLELEIDISNAVIGLSNTDIYNKRVLPCLIYLREVRIDYRWNAETTITHQDLWLGISP